MKKNISINIHGIVFHIEEDAYDVLRNYLESIHAYFASFENSIEIISDIEGRIAEIFATKNKGANKAVTKENVLQVIEKMGSINDFEADINSSEGQDNGQREKTTTEKQHKSTKRLRRDKKREMIGGVCAGLAHHFNIDPVWIRLLFIALSVSSVGIVSLVYLILWIAVPASHTLEDQGGITKMFRNPEHKVIGGVASGVATFLGISVAIVRVLFIASILLGGSGAILYIILWVILPEAKTTTEKMQMQGKPITLSNIEENVKKKSPIEKRDESTLTRILLFPFRLIALILEKGMAILTPIIKLGIALLIIGIGGITTLGGIIALGLLLFVGSILLHIVNFSTIWSWGTTTDVSLPIEAFSNTFSLWMLIPVLLVPIIILVFVVLFGLSILARKIIFNPMIGWILLVLLFVDIVVLGIVAGGAVTSFSKEGSHQETHRYAWPDTVPGFAVHEVGSDDYEVASLNLIGYPDSALTVVKRFEAQGATRKAAQQNAQMVTYQVEQLNNIFQFDSNVTFKDGAQFRAQRVDVEVYIPFGQPFEIDTRLWRIIENQHVAKNEYCASNTWVINEDSMVCTQQE